MFLRHFFISASPRAWNLAAAHPHVLFAFLSGICGKILRSLGNLAELRVCLFLQRGNSNDFTIRMPWFDTDHFWEIERFCAILIVINAFLLHIHPWRSSISQCSNFFFFTLFVLRTAPPTCFPLSLCRSFPLCNFLPPVFFTSRTLKYGF